MFRQGVDRFPLEKIYEHIYKPYTVLITTLNTFLGPTLAPSLSYNDLDDPSRDETAKLHGQLTQIFSKLLTT